MFVCLRDVRFGIPNSNLFLVRTIWLNLSSILFFLCSFLVYQTTAFKVDPWSCRHFWSIRDSVTKFRTTKMITLVINLEIRLKLIHPSGVLSFNYQRHQHGHSKDKKERLNLPSYSRMNMKKGKNFTQLIEATQVSFYAEDFTSSSQGSL